MYLNNKYHMCKTAIKPTMKRSKLKTNVNKTKSPHGMQAYKQHKNVIVHFKWTSQDKPIQQ